MSDIQQFLALMADALHNGALGEEGCADLCKALNGVPAEYHVAAFKAFLSGEDETQDAPEDYAVVKTFDSAIFHIGDEIEDAHGVKALFAGYDDGGLVSVIYAEGCVDHRKPEKWHRTGRNFPAIAAILDKIK